MTSTTYPTGWDLYWSGTQFTVGNDNWVKRCYKRPVAINVSCSDTYSGLSTSASFTKSALTFYCKTLIYSATDYVVHVYNGSKYVFVARECYGCENRELGGYIGCDYTGNTHTAYMGEVGTKGTDIYYFGDTHNRCQYYKYTNTVIASDY